MKNAIVIGLGAAGLLAVPALANEADIGAKPVTRHPIHSHVHHLYQAYRAPEAPAPGVFAPLVPGGALYPEEQGDDDGLSRNPDDCNKGCIGGNSS